MAEEKDESQLLIFGFADNALAEPTECIRHVFNELIKVGHTVRLYTYHKSKAQNMADLQAFVDELAIPNLVIEEWNEVLADVYFDTRAFNSGSNTGLWVFYGALLRGELIINLQHNLDILADQTFWQTGKRGSGIVSNGPKIIGLDGTDLTNKDG